MSGVKHVYILGAGFSVPLGGPLFTDLLSSEMVVKYRHKFEEKYTSGHENEARVVHQIPEHLFECRKYTGVNPNAEQILELFEDVIKQKENWLTRQLLERMNRNSVGYQYHVTPESAFKFLKVRLALETNWFLDDLDADSERWIPYDKWFSKLSQFDTIITTNYDLVLEELFKRRFKRCVSEGNSNRAAWPRSQTFASVYKLHGSCDWHITDEGLVCSPFKCVADLIKRDVAIGTPGTGKRKLSDLDLIGMQWESAKIALEDASIISIVGYSLPETDNLLRMMLLDAVNSASSNGNLKSVNIVLGSRNERGYRARSIIKQATKNRRDVSVNLLPVYAQDYLPYFQPLRLDSIDSLNFPD